MFLIMQAYLPYAFCIPDIPMVIRIGVEAGEDAQQHVIGGCDESAGADLASWGLVASKPALAMQWSLVVD